MVLLQRCGVCGIKQRFVLTKDKRKLLPFNHKTECPGNNLGTSQDVNGCNNFSEYFVLFIAKASNFYKRKLMACFPAVPAVKAS